MKKIKNEDLYLYKKMREKITEVMTSQKKANLHELAQILPNKMRLTRSDVYKVLDEMKKKGMLRLKGGENHG